MIRDISGKLLKFVNQKIRNEQYQKIVQDHLKSVKGLEQTNAKDEQAYCNMLKAMFNKKVEEEQVLNYKVTAQLFDERLKKQFGHIPNNCLHLRSSFYTWRVLK